MLVSLGSWFLAASVMYAQPYAFVANGGSSTVSMLNLANNTVTGSVNISQRPGGVAVSADGSTVYVSSTSYRAVSVMNAASKSISATIGVGGTPTQLALSPNGRVLYVVDQGSNQVSVIDTTSNVVVATIAVGNHPAAVAFSPDATKSYVANMWSNTLSVIDASRSVLTGSIETQIAPSSVAVSPNGHIYVANQGSANVSVHDVSGAVLAVIPNLMSPVSVALTPNGNRLFVANETQNSIAVVDTSSNAVVANVAVDRVPVSVAVTADGSQVLVANMLGSNLSVIDANSYEVIKTVPNIGIFPVAIATPAAGAAPPPPPPCTYSFTSGTISIGAGVYSGTAAVVAPGGCTWTVTSNNTSWLNVTSGGSGTGNGTVTFSTTSNPAMSNRSGALVLSDGGGSFTVTQGGQSFSPIRVNAGGAAFTDGSGNTWMADTTHNFSITTAAIQNADLPAVYQKEAFASGNGLSYQFAVPNGTVTVKLRFSEFYFMQRGARVMNITINGTTVMSRFDILAHTSPNSAYDLTFPTTVNNGQVTIQIIPVTGPAKVSGIEIY
jgi:YVTN family beta-propeller protein